MSESDVTILEDGQEVPVYLTAKVFVELLGSEIGEGHVRIVPKTVALSGRTARDIAAAEPKNIYGMQTFKVLVGEVQAEGNTFTVNSPEFGRGNRVFFGGEVMSIQEARKRPDLDDLRTGKDFRSNTLILARNGKLMDFDPLEDEVI